MPRAWVWRARPSWCQVRPCHRAKREQRHGADGAEPHRVPPEHVVRDVDARQREDDGHGRGETDPTAARDESQPTARDRLVRTRDDAVGRWTRGGGYGANEWLAHPLHRRM